MDRVRQVSEAMREARVAIYPIEAAGVEQEKIYAADLAGAGSVEDSQALRRGNTQGAMAGAGAGSAIDRPENFDGYAKDSAWRAERMMSEEEVAEQSGGRAFFSGNDLAAEALEAIAEGSSYYTLAYRPEEKAGKGGAYRRIQVTIAGGKSLHLDYRRGYWLGAGAAAGQ